jgi:hypothetical protein
MRGATSIGARPWSQGAAQKGVLAPLPTLMVVAAYKIAISVLQHGFPDPTQIFSGSFHSSQGQRSLRAVANFSKCSTPRPPYFLGRHTTSQLTLHFAPVVESLADQRKALSILFMKFKVPGGMGKS